jgi:methylenetetrahydrofolate dehydrogenase (NADP+)/methenyltetrahydrofolate cyclohydrolase
VTLLGDAGPRLLKGGPIAEDVRTAVAADAADFRATYGYVPELAVVIVGRDAPSTVYLHKILDGCRLVGIGDRLVELGDDCGAEALGRAIEALGEERTVAGIIVQQPLPAGIPLRVVIDTLDPGKDIDGIHPLNAGLLSLGYEGFLPATAHAAVELLKRSGIELAGKRAVIVGRSNVVGKPAALLLLREHATVTVCHSKTPDLPAVVREADVVVVATGKPGLVTGEMLRKGAVVVDVGINVVEGRLVGDVDFASAAQVASAITPVPGGVGPLTNAILLTHLMRAARNQVEGRTAPGTGSLHHPAPAVPAPAPPIPASQTVG